MRTLRIIAAYTRWGWAEIVYLAETIGYAIRHYDPLADQRRWRWQPAQQCGYSMGLRWRHPARPIDTTPPTPTATHTPPP